MITSITNYKLMNNFSFASQIKDMQNNDNVKTVMHYRKKEQLAQKLNEMAEAIRKVNFSRKRTNAKKIA